MVEKNIRKLSDLHRALSIIKNYREQYPTEQERTKYILRTVDTSRIVLKQKTVNEATMEESKDIDAESSLSEDAYPWSDDSFDHDEEIQKT